VACHAKTIKRRTLQYPVYCKSGVAAYILSLFYLAHEPEKILLLKFLNGFAGWSTMDLSGLSKRFIRRPG